jgi:hypothetical protein
MKPIRLAAVLGLLAVGGCAPQGSSPATASDGQTYYDNVSAEEARQALASDLDGDGWKPLSMVLQPNSDTVKYGSVTRDETVANYIVETIADKVFSKSIPQVQMRDFRTCYARAIEKHIRPEFRDSVASFVTGKRRGTRREAMEVSAQTIASARHVGAEAAALCPQFPVEEFENAKF